MFITFVGKSSAVKVIYAELLIVSRVKVRSKILWQEKLGRIIPWSKVYLHSHKSFSTNQEHDVFFRVLHYVLKTGEYFSSWTRLHISLDCSFCPSPLESLEHLFLSGAFAKEVWGWVTPLFCKLLGDSGFVLSLGTPIGLDFVEGFPWRPRNWQFTPSQADPVCYLAFQEDDAFEKVACTAQNAISLVEFSFKQTCSTKFEFYRRQLKLYKFKKHWSIGEAFWTDWFFFSPDVTCLKYFADCFCP